MIVLYVWENAGGVSIWWDVPQDVLLNHPGFFMFGRYCGGWMPLGRMGDHVRSKFEEGAARARELTGLKVRFAYETSPPAEAAP